MAPRNAKRNAAVPAPSVSLLPTDVVLTKGELAARLRMSERTLERSGCPYFAMPKRADACGSRYRRRYVERVALAFFASSMRDPRLDSPSAYSAR